MRRCIPAVLLVWLTVLLVLAADPATKPDSGKPKSVAEQLAAIQKEQKARQEQLTKQLEKLQADLEGLGEQTAKRYFDLVTAFPKDRAILPALEYLVVENTPHAGKALDLIEQHHLSSPRLGKLCLFLSEAEESKLSRSEKFLRAVLAKNATDEVQGLAGLSLARLLYGRAEAEGARPEKRAAGLREVETLLDKVVKKYGKVKLPDQEPTRTVAAEAQPMLFEVRHLGIGKTVPDLAGPDLDGKAFRLSEYRGKVVLLDFWAFSSGGSVAFLPHERRLLSRMKDRPFAIVGINGDDPEELPALREKTRIPYRSFRNDRKDRLAISAEWNLKVWPTLFLIDHKGIIRSRWVGLPADKAMDQAIEALVRSAEDKAK